MHCLRSTNGFGFGLNPYINDSALKVTNVQKAEDSPCRALISMAITMSQGNKHEITNLIDLRANQCTSIAQHDNH